MRSIRVSDESGVSLAEILVALTILSFIGGAVIAGIVTSFKSNDMARIRVSAESLARSELEYVTSQTFQATTWTYTLPEGPYPTWWTSPHTDLPDGYDGYSVTVSASNNIIGTKSSIQTLTAVVQFNGSSVLSISTLQSH